MNNIIKLFLQAAVLSLVVSVVSVVVVPLLFDDSYAPNYLLALVVFAGTFIALGAYELTYKANGMKTDI